MKKIVFLLCVVLSLSGMSPAAAAESPDAQPWLNISVKAQEDHANVQVHLPLNMVLMVMDSISVEGFDAGKIKMEAGDAEIDWAKMLTAVKGGPVGKYVTVDSDEAKVDISRTVEDLVINVHQKTDEKAEIAVRLPLKILDAVVIDEENRIDVAALLRSFKTLPKGDLVTVKSEEANVRIWVE